MFGAKGLASILQWNCLAHCSRMYELSVQVVHVRANKAADTIQMSVPYLKCLEVQLLCTFVFCVRLGIRYCTMWYHLIFPPTFSARFML